MFIISWKILLIYKDFNNMIQLYQDNKLNMDTKEYIKESNIKKNNIIIGGEKSVFKEYRKRIKELRKVRSRRI